MKGAHTMRIAHFSDLHFGAKTLSEADRCFGAAIDRAIAAGAQAAVISGDATDHALDLHAPAAARLAAQVRRLADGCPVLMLQGTYSHEPPGTLDVFRSIGGKHPIHVADSIQQVALTGRGGWVRSPSWQFESLPADTVALFSCLPTVNKATVAAAVGAAQAASAVGEHLGRLLAGFGPANRLARSAGLPTIGVSHGTVFGSVSEHGVPMAGFDHEFTTGALFAAETQAFMLGHIHRHQSWEQDSKAGRQLVAYAGSIGRFHYGEDGDKGFLLWEVDATRASATLVPTPARRTVDIVFEGRPDLSVLREALAQQDVAGASVRADGSADPVSSGTLVFADGRTQPLTAQDLTVESLDYWTSPRSKAQYPQHWRITAPSVGLTLDVKSLLADQELNTARSTRVMYWEGAVSATGQVHGTAVTGRGYVELTGYAERFTQRL